jgi:hypothetical protein
MCDGSNRTPMENDKLTENGIVSKLTQLFALFVIYVFLSGWTFFDSYYRSFQIDSRWLDLPFQEVLAKGFTILFTSGYWLWPLYTLMILTSVLFEDFEFVRNRLKASRLAVTAILCFVLCGILVGVYFASQSAGSARLKRIKDENRNCRWSFFRGSLIRHQKLTRGTYLPSGTEYIISTTYPY